MRKRILIIIAIIIVLGGALFFFSIKQPKNEAGGTLVQKTLNLFPFGKNEAVTPSNNEETIIDTTSSDTTSLTGTSRPRLRKLSTSAIAGATSLQQIREIPTVNVLTENVEVTTAEAEVLPPEPNVENVHYIRYIEKATGNIYDIAIDELVATRISNTTIPRITEAYFSDQGKSVIIRYLDNNTTIATWHGTLVAVPNSNVSRLVGNFLENNITTLSVSPDGSSIFYMRDIGDVTYGYTARPDGSDIKQIFDSSFSEWLSEWSRPNEISLTAKASGYMEGYSYGLASDGTTFSKKIGPIFGLTRLADTTGNFSLFSFTTARGMQLRILNETTGEQSATAINTFPEKCVWSATDAVYCAVPNTIDNHVYPDDWYQGQYFTTDTLWKIDASTGIGFLLADIQKEIGEDIDAINLGLTDDESMLYFTNKRDNLLWGIEL